MTEHATEVRRGERFEFGDNWRQFLESLNPSRIETATASLRTWLGVDDLRGKRFLDAGCGSGLFSLAARSLGAEVVSFDYDPASAACARELRARYAGGDDDAHWRVGEGSVLDPAFLESLGTFDVVYSWGVLHHTGSMWTALDLVSGRVAPAGSLFISLYNDQGDTSRVWLRVKRAYNALPKPLRFLVVWPSFFAMIAKRLVAETLRGHPGRRLREYSQNNRGMSFWRDVIDWVGGLPFEVSKPEQVLDFSRERGFTLVRLKTCGGGHGCNEYLFVRRAGGA